MKRVLFLCTGNSCRSQMAEGWGHKLLAGRAEVFSAGTAPGAVDPRAIKVMAEAGVDISAHRSRHVSQYQDKAFDLVVTVCDKARESCPAGFGTARKLHISFEDPPFLARDAKTEDEALGHYRRVRDEIREFVIKLPETLKEGEMK